MAPALLATARPRYRSASRDRAHLLALHRLARLDFSDREIAQTLSGLSGRAIALLETNGSWTRRAVALCWSAGAGGKWTAWQVFYWRHRLAEKAAARKAARRGERA